MTKIYFIVIRQFITTNNLIRHTKEIKYIYITIVMVNIILHRYKSMTIMMNLYFCHNIIYIMMKYKLHRYKW